MKQTESECLCKPMTQWDYRAWVSVQCVCVLWGISIDPLTSLPNVASISHLIDVLSTQCSTHTNDWVTCCLPTHTLHTEQPNMQWGSALLNSFRLFWIWQNNLNDNLNSYIVFFFCGRSHFFIFLVHFHIRIELDQLVHLLLNSLICIMNHPILIPCQNEFSNIKTLQTFQEQLTWTKNQNICFCL